MSDKYSKKPIINKIEVDEKTHEPIIVEVNENELGSENPLAKSSKSRDFFEETKSVRSVGKQMVMTGLGLSKNETDDINKRQRIFKVSFTILFVVFVVGVLIYTFYKDFFGRSDAIPSWKEMLDIFSEGWKYFLFGILALFLCYLFKALKLTILCKTLSGKFHFKTCFETGIIGHYYNYVTPLAVGGQPFEIYHLSKHGVHGGVASSLSIATYVLNQFAYVILGIVFMIMFKYNTLNINQNLISTFSTTLTVMAIIGLFLCFLMPFLITIFSLMPRFGAMLVNFAIKIGSKLRIVKDPKKTTYKTIKNIVQNTKCLKTIFKKPLPAIICFIMSFAEHVCSASIAYFALKTFGFPNFATGTSSVILEWLQIVQLVMMLGFAVSFIPTPGNAGAADLSFYALFSFSLSAGLAFPAMMLWRLMGFYSFIVIGFLFSTLKKRYDRLKERLGIAKTNL